MTGVDVRVRNKVTIVGDDGPTLVLSHGFGCDQNMWRPLVERLRGEFRLVLFDHVGSGAADRSAWDSEKYSTLTGFADDVLDILRELDLHDVTFVGHSVSAMIGSLAAIAEPHRFDKLILITPSPRYVDDADYRGGFSKTDIDELLESLDSNYLGWSEALAPTIVGRDRPDLQQEWTRTFCRNDPVCSKVFARATFLSDNRCDLPQIAVPTLIIESAHDAVAPREVGAFVHASIPDSQLVTLDTTGHCPHMSDPDATADAVAAFARSA
jgi:sigma-B regulation protein RsbQ